MFSRSQCASSGRGSAEFDDEGDEEITAINTVPLHVHQRAKMMPDSGIQRDADTISEHSARDHQEYLARLGIDPKKIGDYYLFVCCFCCAFCSLFNGPQ